MAEHSLITTIAAPRQVVWELISKQANWSMWTPARRVRLDPRGAPEPDGVGAVRHMVVAGRFGAREQITDYVAPERLAYQLLGSFPVRGYVSELRLVDEGASTRLEWSAKWDDRGPILGGLAGRFMVRTIAKMATGIKEAAERRASADG